MSQALAKPVITDGRELDQYQAASPLDLPAEVFSAALERRKANRAAMMGWIRSALKEGVDYGKIHSVGKKNCHLAAQGKAKECADPAHYSKPCLFKPGAEKICGMLGVTSHFPTLPDYEAAAIQGTELKIIILRCELKDASGRVVAEGVGGRSLSQDFGDFNKSLKMSEKSAHVDATLRMAGLSEIFTQDLDDMPPVYDAPRAGSQGAEPPPRTPPPPESSKPQSPAPDMRPSVARVTRGQVGKLGAMITNFGLEASRVAAWCKAKWGVERAEDLTYDQWRELVGKNYENGKLHQFRAQLDKQPLSEAQLEQVAKWLEPTKIIFEQVAKALGYEDLRAVQQGRWEEVRDAVNRLVREDQKRVWDALPEDEKRRRQQAMEASYHEQERQAGRSGTRGT